MMFEFDGSSSMLRTPRGEQMPPLLNSVRSPVHEAVDAEPLWMKLQLSPPSVDL